MGQAPVFHLLPGVALMLAVLAGCADKKAAGAAAEQKITQTELLSYCPPVEFQDGAAFYHIYTPGGEGRPDKIVYLAVISDLTRNCQYPEGQLKMRVGAAGRIVPGPAFRPAAVTVPIEVRIMRGSQQLFSRIYQYTVSGGGSEGAVQFVFSDDRIAIPRSAAQNARVSVGFAVRQKQSSRQAHE